jgi:hypothetical protein
MTPDGNVLLKTSRNRFKALEEWVIRVSEDGMRPAAVISKQR